MAKTKKSANVEQRQARHGEKMIEVKLRFWTDEIAEDEGHVLPKHAWASGVVRMERNKAHGIAPLKAVPFNSMAEINVVIERVLIDHGIRLRSSRRMRRYLED